MSLVEEDDISINQLATPALAGQVSALIAEEYLGERARHGDQAKFERALAKVADLEPDEQDRL